MTQNPPKLRLHPMYGKFMKEDDCMSSINNESNYKEFIHRTISQIHRDGVKELVEFLDTETDFFYAPCSTRFHLCVEGGLVDHSLRVDNIFNALCDIYYPEFPVESRHLCALFHDLCKYHCYNPVRKSRKTGNLQPNGKPEWEDYIGYDFEEEFPYGHGEKSVYILQKFVRITDEEAMAIRWHMGFSDSTFKGGQQSVSNAMKLFPVIALLHSADIIATSVEE